MEGQQRLLNVAARVSFKRSGSQLAALRLVLHNSIGVLLEVVDRYASPFCTDVHENLVIQCFA